MQEQNESILHDEERVGGLLGVSPTDLLNPRPLLLLPIVRDLLGCSFQLSFKLLFRDDLRLPDLGPVLLDTLSDLLITTALLRLVKKDPILGLEICLLLLWLLERTPTAQEVDVVLDSFFSALGNDNGNRFAQEKHTGLQLVVLPDHNRRVHVHDEQVHGEDEDEEDESGDLRISIEHGRVGELSEEHLVYCRGAQRDRAHAESVLSERNEADDDEDGEEKGVDGCEGDNVRHRLIDRLEEDSETGEDG